MHLIHLKARFYFFFWVLQIIKSFEDEETRAKLITEQFLFFAIGTMGILKSEEGVL